MGRFRRRKPTVAWLPHTPHDESEIQGWIQGTNNNNFTPGDINTTIHSLTVDYPAEAIRSATEHPTMADYEASGYRLRRVVGKIFVGVRQDIGAVGPPAADYPTNVLVGAGFMVLRVDTGTGAPLAIANPNSYSPLWLDNQRDPWIWRRTWLLTNEFGSSQGASPLGLSQAPTFNGDYGSVQDGPHIDQKTARRIGPEERLFFILSTVNVGDAAESTGTTEWILDYRLLGSPLKVMGNRRNASR